MNYKNFSIGKKLTFGFGILMILIVVLGLFSYSGISSYHDFTQSSNLIGRIQANLLYCRLHTLDYFKRNNQQAIKDFNKRARTLDELINLSKNQITSSEENNEIQEISQDWTQYKENFNNIITINNEISKLKTEKEETLNRKLNKKKIRIGYSSRERKKYNFSKFHK